VQAFRAALPLLDHHAEALAGGLSGYLFTRYADGRLPTLLHIGDYDSTAEELYASVGPALECGYAFAAVDAQARERCSVTSGCRCARTGKRWFPGWSTRWPSTPRSIPGGSCSPRPRAPRATARAWHRPVGRAAQALLLLILPVGAGLAVLAPYDSRADGAIALAIGIGIALAVNRLLLRATRRPDRPRRELAFQVSTVELALAPVLCGASLLVSGDDPGDLGHGLLGFGNLASIGVGILGAWVLLVEILR
jgi:hypothetical protein